MNNIFFKIEDFLEKYENWRVVLESGVEDNKTFNNDFYEIISLLKNECKITQNTELDFFKQFFKVNEDSELIKLYVEKALICYNSFEKLRGFQENNIEEVKKILKDIMENYIVNYDPNIIQKYVNAGWYMEEIENILVSLDTLVEFYVKSFLTREIIIKDFEDETGLTYDCCVFFVDIYLENKQELKLNFIIKNLD